MSICNENINGQPFSEDVILEQINRDYGLTKIYNINSGIIGCAEIFNGPIFTSNLTKLVTGMTETSSGVFNTTNNDVTFESTFTGNVSTLTAYTGNFMYKIYGRPETDGFVNPPTIFGGKERVRLESSIPTDTFENVLIHSAVTSFSGITMSGFSISDININVVGDQEYVLNSNFSFIMKDCLYGDEIIGENLGNVYDSKYSLYFVTLEDPNTPTLGPLPNPPTPEPSTLTVLRNNDGIEETYVFGVPKSDSNLSVNPNCRLITEQLDIVAISADTVTLGEKPYDDTLMLSVNGITLSEFDYTITDSVIVTLTNPLSVGIDSVTATYLFCGTFDDNIKSEIYQVTGVTSGATSAHTPTDKVYYNTDHSKYEYYTDNDIDDEDNTIMFINGVKLIYGLDYYGSTSSNNRLIFNDTVISVSDIIHIIYNVGNNVPGDYGLVGSSAPTLTWTTGTPIIVSDRIDGSFLVEVTDSSDKTFITPIKQETIDYADTVSTYTSSIDISLLEANKTYIWRVISNKTYTGLLDNKYSTTTISKIGKFFTDNTINSY